VVRDDQEEEKQKGSLWHSLAITHFLPYHPLVLLLLSHTQVSGGGGSRPRFRWKADMEKSVVVQAFEVRQ